MCTYSAAASNARCRVQENAFRIVFLRKIAAVYTTRKITIVGIRKKPTLGIFFWHKSNIATRALSQEKLNNIFLKIDSPPPLVPVTEGQQYAHEREKKRPDGEVN